MRRLVTTLSSSLVAAAVLTGTVVAAAPATAATTTWDTSWEAATAPTTGGPSQTGFTDTTLRQVTHLSAGGDAVRVTLSNVYGSAALRVDRTTVATSVGDGAVAAGSVQALTFSGRAAVTLPAGAQVTSDPLTRTVAARSDLAVSTYLAGPTGTLDVHGLGEQSLYTASGNRTTSTGAGFTAVGQERYVLTDVQVHPTDTRPTIAFFGDSITDGYASTADANRRYPDQVAAMYDAAAVPAVANSGISGNLLLADNGSAGIRGVERFVRDVVARPGVETAVVLIGINDINNIDATGPQLAAGYRAVVSQAHAAGIEVVGATILPERGFAAWTPARERARQAANTFIRTSGVFDDVVDLDAAVRDPAQPDRLRPAYDSGDHLHPGDLGYRAMAAAVFPVLQGLPAAQ